MDFLKRNGSFFLFLVLIFVIYFILRLPNLTLQPIFADEAIYIRWSQIMKSEPTLRFISLQDGKTPLFMWTLMPLLAFFKDPLFAGRLLSVISGFMTLLGVFSLSLVFFNKRVALWAGFFIAITPIFVFFDRLSLVDSMFSAFTIWSLFGALLLIRYTRFDLAMVLGFLIGGSILVKTPGYFNLFLLPTTLITFPWSQSHRIKHLLRLFLCWGITILIALIIYNALRVGPGFDNLSSRNQDYLYPWTHIFISPINPLFPHLKDILFDWFPKMISWFVLLLVLGGVILSIVKKNLVAVSVLVWGLIPLFAESALIKAFTLRYILFTVPPFIVLAGFFADFIVSKFKKHQLLTTELIILLVLGFSLNLNYNIITNPQKANLPKDERHGYLEDWTAGYGFSEIAEFLKSESKNGPIVVGTEGFFGTLPDGLWIYLDKASNVTVIGSPPEISQEIRTASKEHPTYFVANRSRVLTDPENTVLIKEYPKTKSPNGFTDAILLYKVEPN